MRKITARPYQQEAVEEVFKAHASGSPGALVRLPTGCGKTITAGLAARRWLSEGIRRKVFILCHETQLVHQFAREMRDVLQTDVAIEQGSNRVGERSVPDVVVASRASLAERYRVDEMGFKERISRLNKFDPSDDWLVIVDEAHRYSRKLKLCGPVFEHFEGNQNSFRLGITATPWRTDGISLESLFPTIACDLQLIDLDGGPSAVNDGWCVPYVNKYVMVQGVDFGKDIKVHGSDFDEESLAEILSGAKVLSSLVDPTIELSENRRTLVFCVTVEMSKKVAEYINIRKGAGSARQLDGGVPHHKREETYRAHRRGDFQYLVVCSLCREGYDDPGIQAVAILRPTKSTSLSEQMKGRGARPAPGVIDSTMTKEERLSAIANSCKPNCLIIDLVGVTGLAGAASAARCYAEGQPDEVVERAEAIMIKGQTDLKKAIDQAKEEVAKEAAEARRLKEDEERRAEVARVAMLEARARYKVSGAAPGLVTSILDTQDHPTEKQIRYLKWIRLSFNERLMTKQQASKIISMHKFSSSMQKIQNEVDKWELKRLKQI